MSYGFCHLQRLNWIEREKKTHKQQQSNWAQSYRKLTTVHWISMFNVRKQKRMFKLIGSMSVFFSLSCSVSRCVYASFESAITIINIVVTLHAIGNHRVKTFLLKTKIKREKSYCCMAYDSMERKRAREVECDGERTTRYWNEHEDNNVLVGYCNECKQIVTTLSEAKWMRVRGTEEKEKKERRKKKTQQRRHRPSNNVQNWIFVNNIFPAYG